VQYLVEHGADMGAKDVVCRSIAFAVMWILLLFYFVVLKTVTTIITIEIDNNTPTLFRSLILL
jgi:hypothetical protein